jgi:hypothetical protein
LGERLGEKVSEHAGTGDLVPRTGFLLATPCLGVNLLTRSTGTEKMIETCSKAMPSC